MTENNTRTLTIAAVKRLSNSANGNPRYELTAEDGTTYRTGVDSTSAFVVDPTPGRRAEVSLNEDGHIAILEYLS